MSNIEKMQESIAVQTERIGKGLEVLSELRALLDLPKFQGDGNQWMSTRDLEAWVQRLQEALTAEDVVRMGSTVVSWDHQDTRYSGLKGRVIGFKQHEGCLRYRIAVETHIVGSAVWPARDAEEVIPPVNGIERLFGGRCNGVELAS